MRDAFLWVATFLADQRIFDVRFLPYPKQLVPLANVFHGVRVWTADSLERHAVRLPRLAGTPRLR